MVWVLIPGEVPLGKLWVENGLHVIKRCSIWILHHFCILDFKYLRHGLSRTDNFDRCLLVFPGSLPSVTNPDPIPQSSFSIQVALWSWSHLFLPKMVGERCISQEKAWPKHSKPLGHTGPQLSQYPLVFCQRDQERWSFFSIITSCNEETRVGLLATLPT